MFSHPLAEHGAALPHGDGLCVRCQAPTSVLLRDGEVYVALSLPYIDKG